MHRPIRIELDALTDLDATLAALDAANVTERLWAKDHTLWRDDPTEIANRLGWLDLARQAPDHDPELAGFLTGVRDAGLTDAVVLGMGGSSLGAEALRASTEGRVEGLRLHVLDSTHPDWVRRVRGDLDPAKTLFLVASKSGTTAEVMAFFHYFWAEAVAAVGEAEAGSHFVVVTDPGSPLIGLAEERRFRHVFLNPSDIGGRFSVLSRFGLVAAALIGIDPGALLGRAHALALEALAGRSAAETPGVWLGAVLGTAARAGRDQLTLLASPRFECFGLWAEQLIAESTGKDGVGILPVTGEPAVAAERYDDRRLFVALRDREAPGNLDAQLDALVAAGHPVVVYELEDLDALGAELFRWQVATAVAGHLLAIHPFDQPNVQSAKSETRRLLDVFESEGTLPAVEASADLLGELSHPPRPTYVALMAFTDASPELEAAITDLRHHLLDDLGLATTFGYGPRFLHSTGQLHKGGAPGGLFVQLVTSGEDLAIAGQPHGFGILVAAQSGGDLAALQKADRRCVRLDLGDDPVAAIRRLIAREEGMSPVADLPFF